MRIQLIADEVWNGLRRNLSVVVSVVLVTFISLSFVGAAILLQMQITQMKGFWYDRAQVGIYFCGPVDATDTCTQTAATEEQVQAVREVLETGAIAQYVGDVEFEDREAAYANFMDQFGGTASAEFASPETMNEALRVRPTTPDDAALIREATSSLPGVLEVRDQQALLEPIFQVLNTASLAAIGVAVLMLVAAVLLISTTIRLSAFSRKRELGIMRLVGASNRFIQTPFIIEGVVAALLGAVLAAGSVVAIVHFFLQGYVAPMLQTIAIVGVGDALVVAPVLVGIGVLFAGVAAAVAIRRYLRI
ncbi:permease-like cell division protein FtsX [Agrococcus sp. SL85]|uniref:permease-like cell division protein FtsX n=1 Tax=Agrococcus sp. SL85 TaxID=2995141 RepID=UPI00226D2753|nr:permease-like cell division protein FtsX [Agrococcus sp. SL85]WAC65555.1 permease-like cell division protein FtsX [Agrococcus sp. SL85]